MLTFFSVLQTALANEDGVVAQRALVSRVLAALGYREAPDQRRVVWEGRPAMVYTWKGTPAGDMTLVGGVVLASEELEEVGGELRRKKPTKAPTPTRTASKVMLPAAAWARVREALAPVRSELDAYPVVGLERLRLEERKLVGELAKKVLTSIGTEIRSVVDDLSEELTALHLDVELVGEGI